jgi:hypothetical protein
MHAIAEFNGIARGNCIQVNEPKPPNFFRHL